jgi:hypothetical protein
MNLWPVEHFFPHFLQNSYTVLHIFRQVLFGTGNQGNHQKGLIILAPGTHSRMGQYFFSYLLT